MLIFCIYASGQANYDRYEDKTQLAYSLPRAYMIRTDNKPVLQEGIQSRVFMYYGNNPDKLKLIIGNLEYLLTKVARSEVNYDHKEVQFILMKMVDAEGQMVIVRWYASGTLRLIFDDYSEILLTD